jgi:NAD(P)-dependent dehydrogenase (short-subunit alcohol dehydrogenase family)
MPAAAVWPDRQRFFAHSVDMADADAVDQAASAIEQALGPIDIWVNNAMVTIFAPFKEIAADEFRRVTEVTYLGNVHGTMAALKRMLPRDRGVIVQVSSALAYRSIPLQSAYCGTKHAITGFTDSLRSELKHDHSKVRITAVQLAAMNTPQFGWARNRMPCKPQPVPPIFQPEVAARAIVWASCHDRRQVAVGAPTLLAEWTQKLAPGWSTIISPTPVIAVSSSSTSRTITSVLTTCSSRSQATRARTAGSTRAHRTTARRSGWSNSASGCCWWALAWARCSGRPCDVRGRRREMESGGGR